MLWAYVPQIKLDKAQFKTYQWLICHSEESNVLVPKLFEYVHFEFKIKYCKCKEGYHGSPSSFVRCTNVNECDTNNFGCSHICVGSGHSITRSLILWSFHPQKSVLIELRKDTDPGAYCICPTGFNLDSNGKDCLPTKKLNDVVDTIVERHHQAAIVKQPDRSFVSKDIQPVLNFCRQIRSPRDGYVIERQCVESSQKRQPGLLCHFGCNQGYSMTGTSVIKCNPTGWSATPPRCKKVL